MSLVEVALEARAERVLPPAARMALMELPEWAVL